MPESSPVLLTDCLLGGIAVLLLLGLWIGSRAVARLGRIERLLGESHAQNTPVSSTVSEPESQSDGAFARFLDQYPDCRELSKSEQFAAYRKWRKQQGLNWVAR